MECEVDQASWLGGGHLRVSECISTKCCTARLAFMATLYVGKTLCVWLGKCQLILLNPSIQNRAGGMFWLNGDFDEISKWFF